MIIRLICIGKTVDTYLQEGIERFEQRIKRYNAFELIYIAELKNSNRLTETERKRVEGGALIKYLNMPAYHVLLDEKGKLQNSVQFSKWFQSQLNRGHKFIHFYIGGPYGFSEEVYAKANEKISMSPMTFSHQMIRLLVIEQVYRAFTILGNEPYHHS